MDRGVFCLIFLFVFNIPGLSGHSYHLGGCPVIEPAQGFEMNKMLGLWYVIQKTSTGSSCLVYNFTVGEEPGDYLIEQTSQHVILGLTPLDHNYHYTGKLTAKDPSVPARMTVNFPLSVAGSASYTIFATDYENYAAIFTCQKIAFSHRQSVSILSRHKMLDKMYFDKIRGKLQSVNINPFDLSIINQKDCPKRDDGVNIAIDPDTLSPSSIGSAVKKVGSKIGDGVEFVAEGAKKLYNKYARDNDDDSSERLVAHPDSEWLP